MSKNLFENDSGSEGEEIEIKTNKDYAKSYNKFRQKELLKKLKDRDLQSSSDSESSSESEEEEIVNNPDFDKEFFKTLSSLKEKNPKIYNKNTKFFENIDIGNSKVKTDNKKPFTLKDYERKVIIEKDGKYEDDNFSDNADEERPESPSYAEEQKTLKQQFKKLLNDDDSENEEFGGIFKKREKTKEQKDQEESEYIEWLAGKKEDINEKTKEMLAPLKQYWNKKHLPKGETFLRDYILNNGYVEENDHVPTYDEIVNNENLSEDEKELEKQAEFEQKYNFRYEEPDKDFIKRYPRTIENSVRKKDDKRKLKREELKQRKLKEKEEKYKEIEMLKALKKKEIEEKIAKLKEVTGNEELGFKENDFEEDFDPEAHDRRMRELFNDDYYQIDEDADKPECPDIEDLKTEDWDNFDPEQANPEDECYNYEPHCEDDDFNMDCEYDPNDKRNVQAELIENTKDKRKRRKRRNQFMEMIKTEKPAFNPEDEKTYGEYIDEYYKMDCEDIIGDMPCRFKYVETIPNDFGLTIEEILLAKTKELNQWASLKKAVQIRSEQDEKRDIKLYKMKAKNDALKRKIFVSIYGEPNNEQEEKESNMEMGNTNNSTESCNKNSNKSSENSNGLSNKKNKRKKKKTKENISDQRVDKGNNYKSNNKIKLECIIASENTSEKTNKIINNSPYKLCNESKSRKTVTKNENIENKAIRKSKLTKQKIEKKNEKLKKLKIINKVKHQSNNSMKINDERLKAYGLNPRKYHKAQRYIKFMKNKKKSEKPSPEIK